MKRDLQSRKNWKSVGRRDCTRLKWKGKGKLKIEDWLHMSPLRALYEFREVEREADWSFCFDDTPFCLVLVWKLEDAGEWADRRFL